MPEAKALQKYQLSTAEWDQITKIIQVGFSSTVTSEFEADAAQACASLLAAHASAITGPVLAY
jgi:hypothetical protein